MKQVSLGLNLSTKKTRKREFLEQMNKVVPWDVLVGVVEPHWPKSKTGRPPFAIETMLRIHYLQQWFGLSDPAMEEALHDMPVYREFAKLDGVLDRLPDESTILRFRHLLEKHDLSTDMLRIVNDLLAYKGLLLKSGTAVDATLISAPSSTKNAEGKRERIGRKPARDMTLPISVSRAMLASQKSGVRVIDACPIRFGAPSMRTSQFCTGRSTANRAR